MAVTRYNWSAVAITTAVVASGAVDAANNSFYKADHLLMTGLKVQAATSDTLPTGLSAVTDYFVIREDANNFKVASSLVNALAGTAIDITDQGVGNQTFADEAIAAAEVTAVSVDIGNNEFTSAAHELLTGMVIQATTTDTLPTGLELATDYWVVKTGANTFKLTDSLAHALAGTDIVDITATGVGTHTFTAEAIADVVCASGGIDADSCVFTSVGHGLTTGAPVQSTTSGVLPGGLAINTVYWAIYVTDDTFKLAASAALATAGTAISLTSVGSGNQSIASSAMVEAAEGDYVLYTDFVAEEAETALAEADVVAAIANLTYASTSIANVLANSPQSSAGTNVALKAYIDAAIVALS